MKIFLKIRNVKILLISDKWKNKSTMNCVTGSHHITSILGLQIKTAMRYHLRPLWRTKIRKWIMASIGKNGGRYTGNKSCEEALWHY